MDASLGCADNICFKNISLSCRFFVKKKGGGALQNECAILTPFINNRYKTWKTFLFVF